MDQDTFFTFSQAAREASAALPFGVARASGISVTALTARLEQHLHPALEHIRIHGKDIRTHIEAYDAFFASHGFRCPLLGQLNGVESKGFPNVPPFVGTLLRCEMAAGVLMGVQDADRICGPLTYDIADEGETFEGLRGPVVCRSGEPVLRDSEAIIASLFQGPDKRTSVVRNTSSVIFFAFGVPGLDLAPLEEALQMAVTLVGPCSTRAEMEVYT